MCMTVVVYQTSPEFLVCFSVLLGFGFLFFMIADLLLLCCSSEVSILCNLRSFLNSIQVGLQSS